MRYFYDTEFLEDGATIELISIGIVAEDGREYYAVNRDFRWSRIARRRWWAPWQWEVHHPWLAENVIPHLPKVHGDRRLTAPDGPLGLIDWQSPLMKTRKQIARGVRDFVLGTDPAPRPDVELWADYGAYDHVVLCQLWGRMIDLPDGVPMFTRDFQQECARLGVHPGRDFPEQADGHHALGDARHLRRCFRRLHHPDFPADTGADSGEATTWAA